MEPAKEVISSTLKLYPFSALHKPIVVVQSATGVESQDENQSLQNQNILGPGNEILSPKHSSFK